MLKKIRVRLATSLFSYAAHQMIYNRQHPVDPGRKDFLKVIDQRINHMNRLNRLIEWVGGEPFRKALKEVCDHINFKERDDG
jgi:hypothetical protein